MITNYKETCIIHFVDCPKALHSYITHHTRKYFGCERRRGLRGGRHVVARVDVLGTTCAAGGPLGLASGNLPSAHIASYEKGRCCQAPPCGETVLDGLSWCKWARSCILTSHVIKRLHIWQVKLRISDRWCHSQSMQRAFPVRAMVITLSEICMNFAVKIVFLLCFGALVRSDYWQVWTTRPKPQCTRLWRSDVELFEHWTNSHWSLTCWLLGHQLTKSLSCLKPWNWCVGCSLYFVRPLSVCSSFHDFPPCLHNNSWGRWGCEVSCGGHHQLRGKTTTGSALDGAVFGIAQILAYLLQGIQIFFSAAVHDLGFKIGRTLLHEKGVACNQYIMW